ncbi:MAG: polyphosphate kinase 2 family protein [Phycisphaeraceae bacterium]|nr:polyphosphate kinase 2 family protein [Phycisphaeraceae bacterium]
MSLTEQLLVRPGTRVDLRAIDARSSPGISEKDARQGLAPLVEEIARLQYRLWAEQRHAVLLVLEGTDTSGKDGTIRHVLSGVNPQGVLVTSFKVPTPIELRHDFLWRIHARTPGRGRIAVFNRSHYQDVFVVRVESLAPEAVWRARYRQINDFERLLTESGVALIKCFLHISREEQHERLSARLDDPEKQWKFSMGDLATRAKWDAYRAAFEDALSECSTEHAPWHVIPADRKWFRNYAVASLVLETLRSLDPHPPAADFDVTEARRALDTLR